MSEYTPTTDEVREAWAKRNALYRSTSLASVGYRAHVAVNDARYSVEDYAEFDRWLDAHDREVAANTLRKFAQRVYNGAPATRGTNFQAFYNDGLHPVLMAEADRIEKGADDDPR